MHMVAPHAGAWIEIALSQNHLLVVLVAPHAGAWIEIHQYAIPSKALQSRSPCGSVD